MKHRRLDSRGLTLVELLVGIALAAVVIAALNIVVINFIHLSQRGRFLNLANAFVEGKVENLRNSGYATLSTGTTSLTSQLPSQLPPGSTASMTVSSAQAGLDKVDISVTYRDQAQSHTYNYTTYIGELGVGH